jgi:hypothetical protein
VSVTLVAPTELKLTKMRPTARGGAIGKDNESVTVRIPIQSEELYNLILQIGEVELPSDDCFVR